MFVTWSVQPSGTGTNAPVILPFMWGRIKRLESVRRAVILLWPPRREDIARLVKNGTLEGGENGREETQLKHLSTSHLDLLAKDDSATLFQWDEPLIFIREKK